MANPKFIDISFAQGVVDWDAISAAYNAGELAGVIIRVGYGNESGVTEDTQFARNQQEARNRGIPRQFYLFAYPGRSSGDVQARGFTSIVGALQQGESISLDMEDEPNYGRNLIPSDVDWSLTCLQTMESVLSTKPLIYMNEDVLHRFDWSPVKNNNNGLWLASYGGNSGQPETPPNPAPWDFWALWQYTSRGSIAGISPVDISEFSGPSANFLKYGYQTSVPVVTSTPLPVQVPVQIINDPLLPVAKTPVETPQPVKTVDPVVVSTPVLETPSEPSIDVSQSDPIVLTKPGYKTTEFGLTALSSLVTFIEGFVRAHQLAVRITAVVAIVLIIAVYIWSRTHVKRAALGS